MVDWPAIIDAVSRFRRGTYRAGSVYWRGMREFRHVGFALLLLGSACTTSSEELDASTSHGSSAVPPTAVASTPDRSSIDLAHREISFMWGAGIYTARADGSDRTLVARVPGAYGGSALVKRGQGVHHASRGRRCRARDQGLLLQSRAQRRDREPQLQEWRLIGRDGGLGSRREADRLRFDAAR
jgi:hypothetical protein